MKQIGFLLCIMSAFLCCAPSIEEIKAHRRERLDILWRTSTLKDKNHEGSISMQPRVFQDFVIINSEHAYDGYDAPVLFLESDSGNVINYWSDYSVGPVIYAGEAAVQYEEFLFLGSQGSVDCVNILTSDTQWKSILPENAPSLFAHNGYLYRGVELDGQNPFNNSAGIIRTPVSTGDWEYVYRFTKTDQRTPSFSSFGFGQLPNGNEVIVWKNRSYVPGNNSMYRTDVFAYDLSRDSLLWKNMEMDQFSGIIPLKVQDNRVFGLNLYSAFAIDLSTGELLWENDLRTVNSELPIDYVEGDFYLTDQTMVIKGVNEEIISLSQNSGQIHWISDNHPRGVVGEFTEFEGNLYIASDFLDIVDPLTGNSLIERDQVNHLDHISSGITIDPIRRVMYFTTYDEILCVKIPDDL